MKAVVATKTTSKARILVAALAMATSVSGISAYATESLSKKKGQDMTETTDHPRFSKVPNRQYTTAKPAPADKEMASIARAGFYTIKGWNLGIMRWLFAVSAPNPSKDGLKVRKEQVGKDVAIIVEPEVRKAEGAIFFIHGGGLVIGSNEEVLTDAYYWARKLGVLVILPSYSLAPEHPFPKGLDDLHATWHWLQNNAVKLGVNPKKIVVGGSSAGGGLAAALTQRLHDEKGVQPAAQLLIYPMLDDRTAARKDLDNVKHSVWNNRSNLYGWTSYLGQQPGAKDVPQYAVPARRADLSGLPPTWIGVGSSDLFLDEDRAYAERLKEAGVNVQFVEVEGGIHVLDATKGEISKAFRRDHSRFASEYVR